jgi:hypothetical protein
MKLERRYVTAIKKASMHRKSALHLELAVGLALFGDSGTKADLTEVYDAAGYDCLQPEGADYKTINRRVNASEWLFDHLGPDEIADWSGDLKKGPRVEAIRAKVESLKLDTINAVKALVGRPVVPNRTVVEPGNGVEAKERKHRFAAASVQHVHLEHIEIAVTADATRSELMAAAEKLMEMAALLAIVEVKNVPEGELVLV